MTKSRGIRNPKGTRQRWVDENRGLHFCQCGCGEEIVLKPERFHDGVPRFVQGHNARVKPPVARKAVPPRNPCECECGELAGPGKRFISGHNGRGEKRSEATRAAVRQALPRGEQHSHFGKTGPLSASWKGGVQRHGDGYLVQHASDHPFAVKRYVMQHRLIAESHLRQKDPHSPFLMNVNGELYLRPGVDVHHINEVKDDNRVENLEVMWKGDHTRHHLSALIAARWPGHRAA